MAATQKPQARSKKASSAKSISAKSSISKSSMLGTRSTKDPLPKELYSILACPECKAVVKYNTSKTSLVCVECKETYPVTKGIPIMLPKNMR